MAACKCESIVADAVLDLKTNRRITAKEVKMLLSMWSKCFVKCRQSKV